ncbi:MAG: hypothetical protein IJQ99_08200 [Synergistaceae bacterium]|nr:hypothetical protein [Synergistaceae bacterium]
MATITVTTINVQAINDSIKEAFKRIDEQQTALDEIDKTVNAMNGVWESEDQRAYAEQFENTKKKIENFNLGIKESLDTMQKYVDNCISIDSKAGRNLRNISW